MPATIDEAAATLAIGFTEAQRTAFGPVDGGICFIGSSADVETQAATIFLALERMICRPSWSDSA